MDDLKAVFRDQPLTPASEGMLSKVSGKIYELLPKKRDPNARRSVLDEPEGWQAAIRNLIGNFYFDGEKAVGTIASGDRFAPRDIDQDTTEYGVTWTCKAVTLFLIGLIFVMTVQMETQGGLAGVSTGLVSFVKGYGLILGYIVAYQWLFKARLSGDELTTMNYFFQTKRHKLSDVVLITAHPRSHIYKIHFADGSKAHIFKYVNGHRELIEKVESAARA